MSKVKPAVKSNDEAPLYKGDVNVVTKNLIKGWAADLRKPESAVKIVVENDKGISRTYMADRFRPDLKNKSIGTGFHGFEIIPPSCFMDGLVHDLRISIYGSNFMLKRGRFKFGPYYETQDFTVTDKFDDFAASRSYIEIENNSVFAEIPLVVSSAIELIIELPDIAKDSRVRLEFIMNPSSSDGYFAIHTQATGFKSQPTTNLVQVESDGKTSWKCHCKINKMTSKHIFDRSFAGSKSIANLKLNIETNVYPSEISNVSYAPKEQSLIKIGTVLLLRYLSPPFFHPLDTLTRGHSINSENVRCKSIYDNKEDNIFDISSSLNNYFNPTVVGIFDETVFLNLKCVSSAHKTDLQQASSIIKQIRPDILLISHDKIYDYDFNTENVSALLAEILEDAKLVGSKSVYLFDTPIDALTKNTMEVIKKFDLVVNLTASEDTVLVDTLGKLDYVKLLPFISPGRLNIFSADLDSKPFLRRNENRNYIFNGFYTWQSAHNYIDDNGLSEAMHSIFLIDMFYNFSVFRTLDMSGIYWNLAGFVDRSQRISFMKNCDVIIYPRTQNLPRFKFDQTVLEATLLGCQPVVPLSQNSASTDFDFFYLRNSMPAIQHQDDKRRIEHFHKVFTHCNSVDFISICLKDHRDSMMRNNMHAVEPSICVVLVSKRPHMIDRAIELYNKQSYKNKSLSLVLHGNFGTEEQYKSWEQNRAVHSIYKIPENKTLGYCINVASSQSKSDYIAKWDDDDLYGSNHLRDFVRYLQLVDIDIFARPLGFVYNTIDRRLYFIDKSRYSTFRIYDESNWQGFNGAGGTLIIKKQVVNSLKFSEDRRGGLDSDFVRRAVVNNYKIVLGDPFNFALCRYGSEGDHTWHADDSQFAKLGDCIGSHSIEECYNIIST